MTQFTADFASGLEKLLITDPEHGLASWFVEFAKIKPKRGKIITPELNAMQKEICEAVGWCLANHVPIRLVIVKPRQKGCSTMTMALLYWFMCCFQADGAIIGGKLGHATNLWKMFKLYADKDGFDWGFDRDTNMEKATFGNGSTVQHETAKASDAGRSATYGCLCVTEAAYWHGVAANPDEVLSGIVNCVSDEPESCIVIESTARGCTGFFAEYYQEAVTLEEAKKNGLGHSGFIKIFSPWFAFDDSRQFHKYVEDDFKKQLIYALKNPRQPRTKAVQDFLNKDQLTFDQDRLFQQKHRDYVAEEKALTREYDLTADQLRYRRTMWISKCKKSMVQLKRDYPTTPEEAFYSSSNQFFNIDGLRHLRRKAEEAMDEISDEENGINGMRDKAKQLHRRRMYGVLEGEDKGFGWQPLTQDDNPKLIQWEPPGAGRNYLISVDTAEGKSDTTRDEDKHCALVIRQGYYDPRYGDVENNGWVRHKVVARTIYECRWDPDILIDMVYRLHHYYGRCMVVPERNNNSGGTVIKGLKDLGVLMYQRTTADVQGDVRSPKPTGKYGFLTTEQSRRYILDNLEREIREYDTEGRGIDFFDLDAVAELENFIKNKKGRYEAAPNHHDDDVMALAIGMNFIESHSTRYTPRSSTPELPRDLMLDEYGYGNRRKKSQWS